MRVNPLSGNSPMKWRDAIIISAILTCVDLFTVFWPQWSYALVVAMPGAWVYALAGFVGAKFFTTVMVLMGLSRLVKEK